MTYLILGLVFLLIYFFPTICASSNRNKNIVSIFILNLFLGWTLLGWVFALIWAFKKDKD